MTTKFLALISVIGLASISIVQAQSPTPSESPAASPSPAKHRTHKKAEATASPAEKAASASTAESPAASPKEKRTRKKAKGEIAASPAASPTASPKFSLGDLFKPKSSVSASPSAATFIAGISGAPVSGVAVKINSSGQVGVPPSSERFKDEIKPMDKTSEAILALKPVTFRYKKEIDSEGTPQFGLVAADVEKVNPDLVARDAQGKVYTVRYDAVNAMLLNEFLKEHRKVEEQKQRSLS
jgi:Chaperone of endosialidase